MQDNGLQAAQRWRDWARCGFCALSLWGGLIAAETAHAEDGVPGPARYNWTGHYVGGHFGYGLGGLGQNTVPELKQAVIFPSSVTGLFGGYQVGYNTQLPSGLVVGVESDISFSSAVDLPATGQNPTQAALDYLATARGRLGYASGSLLPFVTGGLAWGQTTVATDQPGSSVSSKSATHIGWTAGAGLESPMSGRWIGKLEYDYVSLDAQNIALDDPAASRVRVAPSAHLIKLGLNYRLGEALATVDGGSTADKWPVIDSSNWSIHGQTTVIGQGYPAIRSLYQGANSLPAKGDLRETWTATALLGWRLWPGGEFYFNSELDQGFGLAGTLGLAGFANGEAQKAGADVPLLRAQRYFYRQTFGLGGATEIVVDGPNQLSGTRDIDRVTLTVGRIAVGDIFDNNQYAHDPRADFMNWALWASAAYDFPADLPGFTLGAVAELNRKSWTARLGVFQVPDRPNSDVLVFDTGGVVVEFEDRYTLAGQQGKLRLGGFANRGNTGNFNAALGAAAANPGLGINSAISLSRENRLKYGVYANLEHTISDDFGVFGRFSWNDGRNEILSFTDIDVSLSAGVSIKGTRWGRPDDVIGIGAAINGLSSSHKAFLSAGGLGLLIGDGALNYREEKLVESYYALNITKGTIFTTDYQFIANPAFNADRGPVSILAARLHAEF